MGATLKRELYTPGKEGIMSTFSTESEEVKCQCAKLRLEDLQLRIVTNCASIEDLQREIIEIRNHKPFTAREFFEQQNMVKFKEEQANQLCRINNVLEAKARYLSQILGISL